MMWYKFKTKIGTWASDKAFAYYKTQTNTEGKPGSYKNLPRYLEILSNWPSWSLHRRWVIRGKEMSSPSDHWKQRLILLIQECQAETGEEFEIFIDNLIDEVFEHLDEVTDLNLVKYIKEKL